jgi:phosphatidylglycerophosphate synthase
VYTSTFIVTVSNRPSVVRQALAFKAYEIEELADVCFFRPFGAIIAHAARLLGLSPTHLTVVGSAVGIAGGALLYSPGLGFLGFALLILHSIFDSSDGQLARLTGQSTELGRLLDGVAGYVTFTAVYTAIAAGVVRDGGSPLIFGLAALAALSNVAQAQMYDYHRTSYTTIAIKGIAPATVAAPIGPAWAGWLMLWYRRMQLRLIGLHGEVEAAIAARAHQETVSAGDRDRYRRAYYWLVRGWNVLGDNTRFYALGALAWTHRLEWFFVFILVPMNIALAALWLWQRQVDRRFLSV